MNFSPELSAFQGLLISADNINPFAQIAHRGGNEKKILDIVTSMYAFLQEKRYLSNEGVPEKAKSELRKFTFYLILNADLPILEGMVEMPGIDMVIWTIPTITKCLICEMIWGLNMETFLYEIISYCNPIMSLQVLQPFIDSIKYSSPMKCLTKLKILSAACYRLICRLHFFDYDNNLMSNTLSTLNEHFLRCVTYYVTPPNTDKLNKLSEDEKYKYMGRNLYSMISLMMDCLQIFTSTEKFDSEGFEDMYLCTIKPEIIKTRALPHKICESPDKSILESIEKCNTILLDKCMANIMDISVDIFCAWSEYTENGKSMQQTIGELCYVFQTKLRQISNLADHPVTDMLLQISCKPVDIHDIIRVADNDTIIENVNKNNEHKTLWLQALINKADFLDNISIIECLISNTESIKADDCENLVKSCLDHLSNSYVVEEHQEQIKSLAVKLFSNCDPIKKSEIMSNHFSNNKFNNLLESREFKNMITETFNKLVAEPDADLSDITNVFVQNPFRTYTKILNAAIENAKQCDIMAKVMEMLQDYHTHYYMTDTEACMIKTIEKCCQIKVKTDLQRSNFINFVIKLKRADVLSGAKLLMQIVMPNLHKALLEKDNNVIDVQVRLIDGSYDIEELLPFRAPLLAMLAQVLEVVRWNIDTFSGKAPVALEHALQLQIKIFETYNDDIPEKESSWLKNKLRNLSPLNMYYYRKLWNPPGDNFVEVISGEKETSAEELTVFLSKVLCSASTEEWSEVWNSLESLGKSTTLDIFYNSVYITAIAESEHRTDNTWACVVYCIMNLVLITKEKFLSEPLSDNQVETVMDNIVTLVNLVEENYIEEVSTVLMPLLSYISMEKGQDYFVNVKNLVTNIKCAKFAEVVNQLFSNGIS